MIRVNGHYLFEVGAQLQQLTEVRATTTLGDAFWPLLVAEGALGPFLHNSVYRLKTCQMSGAELLARIRELKEVCQRTSDTEGEKAEIGQYSAYRLKNALDRFQTILGAELHLSPLHLVMQKGAYDTDRLVAEGETLFPADLAAKVPEALADIQQATRCLAFELPTACGFHLHRANESVLRRWYDAVSEGTPRPKGRSIGDYLQELDKQNRGQNKVRSALKDLKDLHRNPLIHPEHSLEMADEAIALLGSIQAAVTAMLRDIPAPLPDVADALTTEQQRTVEDNSVKSCSP